MLDSLAIVEEVTQSGAVTREADGPAAEIDLEVLHPQLEKLVSLLASRSMRARPLVRELGDRLSGTAMGNEMQAIAEDVSRLDFASARNKVVDLVRRRGIGIEGPAE